MGKASILRCAVPEVHCAKVWRLCSFSVALVCFDAPGQLLLPCYAEFEVSRACITERGLDQKVALYQRKITETMSIFGASYNIDLRVVNNPLEAGYQAIVGDVFIEVVRNEEMRNDSFIINVTTKFLEKAARHFV